MFKEKSKRLNAELQYNYEFKPIGLSIFANGSWQKDYPETYGTILADAAQKVTVSQLGGALQLEKKITF